jgi:RNA polymerase sigma-70 factor (ECF subfamily)
MEQVRPRFLEKTWQAFRRQMMDGQPADIVAAELDMPIQAVYVAKSRVLNSLRREAAGLVDC